MWTGVRDKFVFANVSTQNEPLKSRSENNRLIDSFSETIFDKLHCVADPKHVGRGEPSQYEM